jgi:hypothetical protein
MVDIYTKQDMQFNHVNWQHRNKYQNKANEMKSSTTGNKNCVGGCWAEPAAFYCEPQSTT